MGAYATRTANRTTRPGRERRHNRVFALFGICRPGSAPPKRSASYIEKRRILTIEDVQAAIVFGGTGCLVITGCAAAGNDVIRGPVFENRDIHPCHEAAQTTRDQSRTIGLKFGMRLCHSNLIASSSTRGNVVPPHRRSATRARKGYGKANTTNR